MAVWKHRASDRLQADAEKLLRDGDVKTASQIWQHLAERHPNDSYALEMLGTLRGVLGAYDAAVRILTKAQLLDPTSEGASYNLGLALAKLGRRDEAAAAFQQAIKCAPGMAEAHGELGRALQDTGDLEGAVSAFAEAARLAPDQSWPQELLGARRTLCAWDGLEHAEQILIDRLIKRALPMDAMLCLRTSDDPVLHQRNAEAKTQEFYAPMASVAPVRRKARAADGKIRLGYLSGDFRNHATAYLLAELIERHDRSKFEVIAFSTGRNDRGAMRQRLEEAFDKFVDCHDWPTGDIAKEIANRGIDILVEMHGHAGNNRLDVLAYRPAPVQVHFLGYPGTLMYPCVDYLIVDPVVVPPEAEQFYGEALCFLPPHTYYVADTRKEAPSEAPTRAGEGLPEDAFVFCAFNTTEKLSPNVFDTWLDILKRVPGSVLWLLVAHAATFENLKAHAAAAGVDASRLIGARRVPYESHVARQSLADLFLDTFPYTAHTTSSDALWAGLPIVTRQGCSFASRVAAGILKAHGMEELVTSTVDEYSDLAVRIALTPGLAAELKARVLANRKTWPLFDTDRFRRNIEQAYVAMWERSKRGEAPSRLVITDSGC